MQNGQERVRVNYRDGNVASVPAHQLQDKSGRYYFEASLAVPPGAIYASRFDLNVEHGRIERPLKPMIRIGTPVLDEHGDKWGIVLVNYLGRDLLDRLDRGKREPLWLVDGEG